MRMSLAGKERTYARIVAGLPRERGLQGTSVSDVMSEAGLIHGGFYKLFESKDALIESALDTAFADIVALVERTDTLAAYQARYPSPAHVENPGRGRPRSRGLPRINGWLRRLEVLPIFPTFADRRRPATGRLHDFAYYSDGTRQK